jgi:hypothetical protein
VFCDCGVGFHVAAAISTGATAVTDRVAFRTAILTTVATAIDSDIAIAIAVTSNIGIAVGINVGVRVCTCVRINVGAGSVDCISVSIDVCINVCIGFRTDAVQEEYPSHAAVHERHAAHQARLGGYEQVQARAQVVVVGEAAPAVDFAAHDRGHAVHAAHHGSHEGVARVGVRCWCFFDHFHFFSFFGFLFPFFSVTDFPLLVCLSVVC